MAGDRGKRLYDLRMHATLGTTTIVHRVLHRLSRGRLGRHFPGGQQVVWVWTVGRRSGAWRTTPLLAVPDPDAADAAWVIAGSNAGQTRLPDWVFNVRAHPQGWLMVGSAAWSVSFEEVTGAARDELYAALTAMWTSYAGYEVRAGRYIPVFRVRLLAPAEPAGLPARGAASGVGSAD